MTESSTSPIPPIAIIGGGLAGLAFSIGLTRHGIPHKIYESASAFSEIGAGIALGPNSVTALELIDPRIKDALESCITHNEGIEDDVGIRREWMDVRVGMEEGFDTPITKVYHTSNTIPGRSSIHRAKFLDGLIKLIPPDTAVFSKSLVSITEPSSSDDRDEPIILSFSDGSTAPASAVVGCDGIKSIIRQKFVLSEEQDEPTRQPVFANEYAYRGMFPREEFLKITQGSIIPNKGRIFCGHDGYVAMYPVEKGRLINFFALKHAAATTTTALSYDPKTWIQPVSHSTILSDFTGWAPPLRSIISHISKPERWALHDHLHTRTYTSSSGFIAIMGDAAHASLPHQGAGASMAFEDAYILSEILGRNLNENTSSSRGDILSTSLKTYSRLRMPRTQFLTKTSREAGQLYEFRFPGVGSDLKKLGENARERMKWIWDVDLKRDVEEAIKGIMEGKGSA